MPCLRAELFSAYHGYKPTDEQNQLECTVALSYTDISRSDGYSVFVGVSLNRCPTFAVTVIGPTLTDAATTSVWSFTYKYYHGMSENARINRIK